MAEAQAAIRLRRMEKAKRQMKSKYVNNICLAVIVWHSQRWKMVHASCLLRRDNQKIENRLEYMDYQRKFISILNKEYIGLVTNDVFSWQVIVDIGE